MARRQRLEDLVSSHDSKERGARKGTAGLAGLLAAFALLGTGCTVSTVEHCSPAGASTFYRDVAFLSRNHKRIQTQHGSPTPVEAAGPVLVPNTASNLTGLEPIVDRVAVQLPNGSSDGGTAGLSRFDSAVSPDAQQHDFFVYDSDVDPEPAVRVVRIGAVASVLKAIIGD